MALLVVPGLGGLAMRRVAGVPPARRVKATIKLVFADPSRYPHKRLQEAISELEAREASAHWASAAFLRSLRELARSQFMVSRGAWKALGQITAPTLVVWGDRDRLVAPSLASAVAAALKDARLLVLKDIGHTAQMEDPETTARAILALVEDTR
jgi:pimeloyl-ACP methyl ester carboxylesterase